VVGGLLGTGYAHNLSKQESVKQEKKIKLEALVTEAHEIDVWVKKQENYYLFNGDEPLELSPIAKIEAIETLYFPELAAQVKELSEKGAEYRFWLIQGSKLKAESGEKIAPAQYVAQIGTYYKPLLDAKRAVVEKAKELSTELNRS
jgi:hypothetical protein